MMESGPGKQCIWEQALALAVKATWHWKGPPVPLAWHMAAPSMAATSAGAIPEVAVHPLGLAGVANDWFACSQADSFVRCQHWGPGWPIWSGSFLRRSVAAILGKILMSDAV